MFRKITAFVVIFCFTFSNVSFAFARSNLRTMSSVETGTAADIKKDLGGPKATNKAINAIIQHLIKEDDGSVVKVRLKDGVFYKPVYIENYQFGVDNDFREDRRVEPLLTLSQMKKLRDYLANAAVIKKGVNIDDLTICIIRGRAMVNPSNDDYFSVSHEGELEGIVFIGEILLNDILDEGRRSDSQYDADIKYMFRHGLDHIFDPAKANNDHSTTLYIATAERMKDKCEELTAIASGDEHYITQDGRTAKQVRDSRDRSKLAQAPKTSSAPAGVHQMAESAPENAPDLGARVTSIPQVAALPTETLEGPLLAPKAAKAKKSKTVQAHEKNLVSLHVKLISKIEREAGLVLTPKQRDAVLWGIDSASEASEEIRSAAKEVVKNLRGGAEGAELRALLNLVPVTRPIPPEDASKLISAYTPNAEKNHTLQLILKQLAAKKETLATIDTIMRLVGELPGAYGLPGDLSENIFNLSIFHMRQTVCSDKETVQAVAYFVRWFEGWKKGNTYAENNPRQMAEILEAFRSCLSYTASYAQEKEAAKEAGIVLASLPQPASGAVHQMAESAPENAPDLGARVSLIKHQVAALPAKTIEDPLPAPEKTSAEVAQKTSKGTSPGTLKTLAAATLIAGAGALTAAQATPPAQGKDIAARIDVSVDNDLAYYIQDENGNHTKDIIIGDNGTYSVYMIAGQKKYTFDSATGKITCANPFFEVSPGDALYPTYLGIIEDGVKDTKNEGIISEFATQIAKFTPAKPQPAPKDMEPKSTPDAQPAIPAAKTDAATDPDIEEAWRKIKSIPNVVDKEILKNPAMLNEILRAFETTAEENTGFVFSFEAVASGLGAVIPYLLNKDKGRKIAVVIDLMGNPDQLRLINELNSRIESGRQQIIPAFSVEDAAKALKFVVSNVTYVGTDKDIGKIFKGVNKVITTKDIIAAIGEIQNMRQMIDTFSVNARLVLA